MPPPWKSHGSGRFERSELGSVGERVVIEEDVLVFNPSHVHFGNDVYVGHRALLDGDTRAELVIGDGSWIGPACYLHSAGGIRIGRDVGLGPGAMILTSEHAETPVGTPIMQGLLELAAVEIGDGADIGVGAVILPGARIGAGVLVGAGAVVTGELEDFAVAAGVPAKVIRFRSRT